MEEVYKVREPDGIIWLQLKILNVSRGFGLETWLTAHDLGITLMLVRSALCDLWHEGCSWVGEHEMKLSALSAMRPQPECHKSRKAWHDNIKWFKVFAVGTGPRFTKVSSSMRLPCHSAVSHHLHPSSSDPKVFFWQPEKSWLVLRADLKQWSDQVLCLRALWPSL